MANDEHLNILRQGVQVWNRWREDHPEITPDLEKAKIDIPDLRGINLHKTHMRWAWFNSADFTGADLRDTDFGYAHVAGSTMDSADLRGAYLREAALMDTKFRNADCRQAILSGASLIGADLSGANLEHAMISDRALLMQAKLHQARLAAANLATSDLSNAELIGADLTGANLNQAFLQGANLTDANLTSAQLFRTDLADAQLTRANLTNADLGFARLIDTDLRGAQLVNCSIHGISVWGVNLEGAVQANLLITSPVESKITVPDLEVAQFIYLLLHNRTIRRVIDTIATKAVLILGRFGIQERKQVLDALAEKLRELDLLPIIFDFEKPEHQDIIETIQTLAGMSRFIIADVTAARVVADELRAFVPDFAVPVVPIFQPSPEEPKPYDSLYTLKKYQWVLEPVIYSSKDALIAALEAEVVNPANAKCQELLGGK